MKHKNKRPRGAAGRGGCYCGGKWDKKVTGYRPAQELRQIDEEPPRRAKRGKPSRKWCRRREGVAHVYEWVLEEHSWGSKSRPIGRKRCKVCRRIGAICYGERYAWSKELGKVVRVPNCSCGLHEKRGAA